MSYLSLRSKHILYAVVTEFLQTGEPVGSRTLSKRGIDLSPASIRNVLSDLEEDGYLSQPHKSAGRVPTSQAYRLYIDALMQWQKVSAKDEERIKHAFEFLERGTDGLKEVGKILSELTGTAALVLGPKAESLILKHMRFIRTVPGEVLAVLVMSDGSLQNRFLKMAVSEEELLRVHMMLDEVIENRTLAELYTFFSKRLHDVGSTEQDLLKKRAFELGEAAVSAADKMWPARLVIEGRDKLFDHPEFADPKELRQAAKALDEEETLFKLLEATIEADRAAVYVGREAGDFGGGSLSFVGASYTKKDEVGMRRGSIAVIGPTRMDYPKVVPIVAATAQAMTSANEDKRSKKKD